MPSLVHCDDTSLNSDMPSLVHCDDTSLNSDMPSLVHCDGTSLYNNIHSTDSTNINVYTNLTRNGSKTNKQKAINLSAKQPHQFGTEVKILKTLTDGWYSPRRSLHSSTFPLN